jgi:hypothetical protein
MAAYLALLSGLFLVVVHLSSHVAVQAIALALPLFPDSGARPPSRVERRQLEIAQSHPEAQEQRVASLTAPAASAGVMAAQLDRAELFDLSDRPPRRPLRNALRRGTPPTALSAGEEFGKRFGILTMASR